MEGYCVKCKNKVEMKDPAETTTKNGKPIMKDKCLLKLCNNHIYRSHIWF